MITDEELDRLEKRAFEFRDNLDRFMRKFEELVEENKELKRKVRIKRTKDLNLIHL